jgi:hypothetical protein
MLFTGKDVPGYREICFPVTGKFKTVCCNRETHFPVSREILNFPWFQNFSVFPRSVTVVPNTIFFWWENGSVLHPTSSMSFKMKVHVPIQTPIVWHCGLCCAHMLFVIVMVQTIAHALFRTSTYAHAIENPAARTYLDTHVLDNAVMQNCCCHTQLQLI